MTLIERSRLRALSTEQVLNIASIQIAAGGRGTDKNMDRTACVGNGLHGYQRRLTEGTSYAILNDGPQTTAE